ncbi:MAG: hypothetical protein AAGB93_04635 [Planctomycetota bacterium]
MNRIHSLVRAQLSGEVLGERTPVAAVALQVVVAALLCAVVRADLPPFGYAVFALSIPLALTTVPLLGELAPLLRADRAAEWVGALPVTPRDLRLARVSTLLSILGLLALASLVPAALLAPGSMDLASRAAMVGLGVLQTWCVAAALLLLQVVLGKGGDAVLVTLQTLVFLAVMVGMLVGLRSLPVLAELEAAEGVWLALPPIWFASVFAPAGAGTAGVVALAVVAVSAVVLAAAPFPPPPEARSTRSALSILLTPARRVAELVWVRDTERGPFAFVYDGLPAERDFVLRTYPLVAAPLLLLLMGADPGTTEGEGLFALLLFAPAAYLPFVLMHVPTTATPEARWVVDTAPLDDTTEDRGALKAVAVRLLLPLYLGIGALVYALASPALALRLWPVAVVAGLATLRLLWRSGGARPLSTRANDLASAWSEGLGGLLIAVAVAMTLVAVAAWRTVPSPAFGWALLGGVVAVEVLARGRVTGRRAG